MNEDEEGAPALKLLDLPLQILHCVFEAAHHQHQAIPLCEHSRAVRKLDPRRCGRRRRRHRRRLTPVLLAI